ncbi:MAG: hypothetical protein AAFO07_01520 [Bacteroidota bacterium]
MPRVSLSNELKAAIRALPEKEKDKLLLRLLPGKPDIVARLEYELLEQKMTLEERRESTRDVIIAYLERSIDSFYSPGYLLLDIRGYSGIINKHVKITKDKMGEIELNLLLVNETLSRSQGLITHFNANQRRTFNEYIIKRAEKIVKLISKLHDDYRLEFQEDLNELHELIQADKGFVVTMEDLGFEMGWLSGEVEY